MKRLVVLENDAGQRLDKFLLKALPRLPKSLLYKGVRKKRIKRNGGRCTIADRLQTGDVIEVYLNDDTLQPDEKMDFLHAPPVLNILYQDPHIVLIDKPAGLLVHADAQGSADTLINRLLHYLYQSGAYAPALENSFTPALCNRIDRNTGGIVIAAKDFATLQMLNEKIKQREISKTYLCLVYGVPKIPQATLRGYHIKNAQTNTVQILKTPVPGAKTALTRYRLLKAYEDSSLLEVELLTGRTHQIRAQMASIGHPLLGDTKYGHAAVKAHGYRFQALYSYKLRFDFPTDAGHLNYLKGRTFQVEQVPFAGTATPE